MAKQRKKTLQLSKTLILNRFILSQLGVDGFDALADNLTESHLEGHDQASKGWFTLLRNEWLSLHRNRLLSLKRKGWFTLLRNEWLSLHRNRLLSLKRNGWFRLARICSVITIYGKMVGLGFQ